MIIAQVEEMGDGFVVTVSHLGVTRRAEVGKNEDSRYFGVLDALDSLWSAARDA